MGKYTHVFFDLDRTLWDYEVNAGEALSVIYEQFRLSEFIDSLEKFREKFGEYNEQLWEGYRQGKIHKDILRNKRFELVLQDFGREDREMAAKLNEMFLELSPRMTGLIPGAGEVLNYLRDRKYKMYIITNGFTEIQEKKMKHSGLSEYFIKMFTSELASANKPRREIFDYAVKSVNARKKESLMVGDELSVDIVGARNAGIDQVYFNPKGLKHTEKVTYEIHHLTELKQIL